LPHASLRSVTATIAQRLTSSTITRSWEDDGLLESYPLKQWDEKAGLRPDAIRSQVIDVLKAPEIKETGNEEVSFFGDGTEFEKKKHGPQPPSPETLVLDHQP
jgi:hypothetical protein